MGEVLMRQTITCMLLALLLCLPLGCNPAEPYTGNRNPSVEFDIHLPEYGKSDEAFHLDANGDGKQEQVILYRYDLSPGIGLHGAPTKAIVYQLDDEMPPNIHAYELPVPGQDYLCECECVPTACRCIPALQDILSGLAGAELVVSDRCAGETVGLTIFHWDAAEDGYQPKGHFLGHRIEVVTDTVTVEDRQASRAQLAMRQSYHADGGLAFLLDDQGTLVTPTQYELVFPHGEPEDITLSPYPEKIVLAFYQHYTDTANVSAYFADETWEGLGQCDTSGCGCAGPRAGVAHVWVTSLEYIEDPTDPNHTTVEAAVACEYSDGTPESQAFVRWRLVRAAGRWQVSGTE